MKNTFCRHKYLFDTDFSNIKTNTYSMSFHDCEKVQDYNIPYNLFDCNQAYIRKISTDILDEKADTLDKFKEIADSIYDVDELLIIDNRSYKNSAIILDYAETTMKSYIGLFYRYGIKKVTVVKTK